jgi:hypothetical protein
MFEKISPIKSSSEKKKACKTPTPRVVVVEQPLRLKSERSQDDQVLLKERAVGTKIGAASAQAAKAVSKASVKEKAAQAQTESKHVQCDIFPINPPLYSDAESFSRVVSIKRVFFCPIYKTVRADIIVQKIYLGDDRMTRVSQEKTVLLRELKYSDPLLFTAYLETLYTPKLKHAK